MIGTAAMPEAEAITFRNVSKVFGGVHALDAVDFSVGTGEVHCLAGENGCGLLCFSIMQPLSKLKPLIDAYRAAQMRAKPLTSVTTTMPEISQAIWAMVSRAVRRFCSWGIRSASAT